MSSHDWEKRARELLVDATVRPGFEIVRAALQLGREMADARAEEIAKRLEGEATPYANQARMIDRHDAAWIARYAP